MADHRYVEHVERRRGSHDVIIAAAIVLFVVMAVVFMAMLGGPGRFVGGSSPSQTNVNVAPQQPPANNSGQSPRQIDINISQPAAPPRQAPVQQPPVQQVPVQQAPVQQAPVQQAPAGQSAGSGR